MAFMELKFFSETLGMQTSVYVVMPQKSTNGEIGVTRGNFGTESEGKYKCLYLLHGLSDDHTIWLRRTSIERYADAKGICVVMPDGDTSFYTDMKYGKKYYTFIAKELPRIICQFYNVSDKREDNYIAGLSMGGYGALKIGLRNCNYFCAAAGLSAVTDMERRKHNTPHLMVPIFGEELIVPEEDHLFTLVEKKAQDPYKPRIYMGVGTDDTLYGENVRLKEAFAANGYDITYRESKGDHNWAFWDEYIQYVLDWMLAE